MEKLTVIIPAYNEEECVEAFYEAVEPFLKEINYETKYLFVDDGSKDKTLEKIKELREKDKRVNYISFSRNCGKEAAMCAGLEAAKDEDAVIIMDADLQHPPYLIKDMVEKRAEGYKIVYARRRNRKGDKASNRFFAKAFYSTFDKYADVRMVQSATDYMILDKTVVKAFLEMPDRYRFIKGIMSYVGFKSCCLEFDFVQREKGTTKWNFKKLLKYGVNGLNQFSNVFIIVPIIMFAISMCVAVASVLLFVFHVLGLESFLLLLLISLLFAGMSVVMYFMMFVLYSTRREALKRPLYFIEESSLDA